MICDAGKGNVRVFIDDAPIMEDAMLSCTAIVDEDDLFALSDNREEWFLYGEIPCGEAPVIDDILHIEIKAKNRKSELHIRSNIIPIVGQLLLHSDWDNIHIEWRPTDIEEGESDDADD